MNLSLFLIVAQEKKLTEVGFTSALIRSGENAEEREKVRSDRQSESSIVALPQSYTLHDYDVHEISITCIFFQVGNWKYVLFK